MPSSPLDQDENPAFEPDQATDFVATESADTVDMIDTQSKPESQLEVQPTTEQVAVAAQIIDSLGSKAVGLTLSEQFTRVAVKMFESTGKVLALQHGFILAPDEEQPRPKSPEATGPKSAAVLLETKRFVREAPLFTDQVADTSRTNELQHVGIARPLGQDGVEWHTGKITTMTEHVALKGLREFLTDFSQSRHKDRSYAGGRPMLRDVARSMLDKLTFIGKPEYDEAAEGFAELWKQFLDADSKHQICVLTKISKGDYIKSDRFLFEEILKHFSPEEIEKYEHRITTELEDITAKPDDTRVILLDDWTISGSQIKQAYNLIENSPLTNAFKDSIEVNLLVSSRERIKKGFHHDRDTVNPFDDVKVPLRAYFVAHEAPATSEYGSHITGFHSSVDFDFENTIGEMVRVLNGGSNWGDEKHVMPPLTNVPRAYRNAVLSLARRVGRAKPAMLRRIQRG